MTIAIRIANLSKTFGTRRALDIGSLTVMRGELVALIGASGSGKIDAAATYCGPHRR